uniref:BORCS6 domain-containing protein n=1 Tax=Strongyloides stercoralis TaxID=6248 RepID=A0A0K0DTQ6_STRER
MASSEASGSSNKFAEEIKATDYIEKEMQTLVGEVDNCLRSLRGTMRGITDLTTEKMEVCQSSISKTCDHGEQAVKLTFSVIAKSEELIKGIKKIDEVHKKIKELKEITDSVERSL